MRKLPEPEAACTIRQDDMNSMLNLNGYRAAQEAVAWSDRSGRVRLEIAGPDRASSCTT